MSNGVWSAVPGRKDLVFSTENEHYHQEASYPMYNNGGNMFTALPTRPEMPISYPNLEPMGLTNMMPYMVPFVDPNAMGTMVNVDQSQMDLHSNGFGAAGVLPFTLPAGMSFDEQQRMVSAMMCSGQFVLIPANMVPFSGVPTSGMAGMQQPLHPLAMAPAYPSAPSPCPVAEKAPQDYRKVEDERGRERGYTRSLERPRNIETYEREGYSERIPERQRYQEAPREYRVVKERQREKNLERSRSPVRRRNFNMQERPSEHIEEKMVRGRRTVVVSTGHLPPKPTAPVTKCKEEQPGCLTDQVEIRSRVLFLRTLSKKLTGKEVLATFERFGPVRDINMSNHQDRGIAFVTYYDIRDAEKAKRALDGDRLGDRRVHIHYSKPAFWENTSRPPQLGNHQGTVQVVIFDVLLNKEELGELKRMFSQYGPILEARHESTKVETRVSVEFFDARDCARAFDSLRRAKFLGHNMHLSFAWDADYIRLQDGMVYKAAAEASLIPDLEPDAGPVTNFFIARERDPRKPAEEPVPVEQIIGHGVAEEPATTQSTEPAPTEALGMTAVVHEDGEGDRADENSSPQLLAEMSCLLSSLQKKTKNPPPLPPPCKEEPKIDSVQQLARFLLEQSQCPQ